MAEKQTDIARSEEKGVARREPQWGLGAPFQTLERFAEEMDRVFDDFGFGRGRLLPRLRSEWLPSALARPEAWMPEIELLQRNNELVVRADLPGIAKDDVKVEITDNAIAIQGERRREHEETQGGVYRSERSYGSFRRVIGLPEGAMTEQAKAAFKDGVLEITMPAPPETVTRGRKLEITEAPAPKK
jgi:HSP20 family protein